jgi:AraC-like DNA-binding protein
MAAPTDQAITQDEQALALRSAGKSFSTIAKTLGYERSHHANEAFLRALKRKPADARSELRDAEAARLDALAAKIQAREDLTPAQAQKRLRAVERLRQTLMME